jgi:N-6 DNA Methylase
MAGKYPVEVTQRFGAGSAAVVVGNPPWGYPKKEDVDGRQAMVATMDWCVPEKNRPVGDKELSQAFIHLTLSLLQDGGRAGLLVSSGVLYKRHEKSRQFRHVWLNSARLEHIVNFAHVRQIFFSGVEREAKGISPFISAVFTKSAPTLQGADSHFEYWSAKRTAMVANTQSVVLSRGDMHWLSQRDCLNDEKLWKIYWWGGHRDEALIRTIERFPALMALPEHIADVTVLPGQGFKEANKKLDADWLENYRELRPEALHRYGAHNSKKLLPVPKKVERRGVEEVYSGHRLLVGRGIKAGGFITSRFETKKFCFRNSIHGVRFEGLEGWQEAVITAIFWSSLARYYYFTTTGSWGLWHDEIHLENVQDMPIRFPTEGELRNRIVRIVVELQKLEPTSDDLFGSPQVLRRLFTLESELDEAVLDLFELTAAERDLVTEMCGPGLDLFYRSQSSSALSEVTLPQAKIGTANDLPAQTHGLSDYLRIFLSKWNTELAPEGEFVWRVLSPPSGAPLLAVSFTTHYKDTPVARDRGDEAEAWRSVLSKLNRSSLIPAGSDRIFIDTFLRYVRENEILFIKRNEQRFWTRTAAREDAESALTFLINSAEPLRGGTR